MEKCCTGIGVHLSGTSWPVAAELCTAQCTPGDKGQCCPCPNPLLCPCPNPLLLPWWHSQTWMDLHSLSSWTGTASSAPAQRKSCFCKPGPKTTVCFKRDRSNLFPCIYWMIGIQHLKEEKLPHQDGALSAEEVYPAPPRKIRPTKQTGRDSFPLLRLILCCLGQTNYVPMVLTIPMETS